MNKQKSNKFSIKMQKKLVVLFMIVLLAFAGLSAKLFWLANEKENQYQKQVLSQQQYSSTILPYRRGDIVDARGTKLATCEKVYNLVIDAKVMNTELSGKKPYLEPTLKALGQCFALDMSQIREYVSNNTTSSWYVPTGFRRMSYEEISAFLDAQQEDTNIKGVWFEEEYKRVYPYNTLAADAIGFTTSDGIGSYGLEEYYDSQLSGVNGREYGYLNDDLALERTVRAAVDGNTVHTTIDANVQMIVEKYLKQFMEEHKNGFKEGNGAENVGCVMMEVNTGEIIAMASYPTYDLNDTRNTDALIGSVMVEMITNANGYQELRKTDTVINEEVLNGMDDDQTLLNLRSLWNNYCINGTYEPGSTIKPFTVAEALETGTISPNSTFECNGSLEIGGYTIKCHNRYDGTLTLRGAVAKSCNVSMMKIGQALGKDLFAEYQGVFNFGLKTNIDLAGEARTDSLIYSADEMGPTDLATNTFGQNFNVTMIQLITGFSSLINGGYYYEPHMVNKITNASGATIENIEPRVLKQTISESTSEYIRQYCTAVVTEGTGKTARPAGYLIGGKTGTAETIDPKTHKRSETDHVVSFIGFAPVDDPQVAIYVVVDRPNVSKQGDAKYATGIVRNILTEALPYLNIYMTEELSEAEEEELAAKKLEITTQYSQKQEETEGTAEEAGANYAGAAPKWMSFPVDPASGYRVDPDTGDRYDAQSGVLIDSGETNLGTEIPVNPNIE